MSEHSSIPIGSTREWSFEDKASWGSGPWHDEPDKVQWVDEPTGLDCLAVRSPTAGAWCGYVGVPEGHPLFGVDDDTAESRLDEGVHGGLTFSDTCQEGAGVQAICHIPEPGRSERVWWLGWDATHVGDYCPKMESALHGDPLGTAMVSTFAVFGIMGGDGPRDTYRTLDYVRAECARLAEQLAALVHESATPARSSS